MTLYTDIHLTENTSDPTDPGIASLILIGNHIYFNFSTEALPACS
jgi:hypothetical protein